MKGLSLFIYYITWTPGLWLCCHISAKNSWCRLRLHDVNEMHIAEPTFKEDEMYVVCRRNACRIFIRKHHMKSAQMVEALTFSVWPFKCQFDANVQFQGPLWAVFFLSYEKDVHIIRQHGPVCLLKVKLYLVERLGMKEYNGIGGNFLGSWVSSAF